MLKEGREKEFVELKKTELHKKREKNLRLKVLKEEKKKRSVE